MQGVWLFVLLVFFAVVLLLQGTVVPVFSDARKMRKRIASRLSNAGRWGRAVFDPQRKVLARSVAARAYA
jgi:hypothetical protein